MSPEEWERSQAAPKKVMSPAEWEASQEPSRYDKAVSRAAGMGPLERLQVGGAEAAMNMGSSLYSAAKGGLQGAMNWLGSDEPSNVEPAAKIIEDTAQADTYQPRTAAGKVGAQVAALPLALASQGAGDIGRRFGGMTGELYGDKEQREIAGQSIGEVVPQAVATVAGGRSVMKPAADLQRSAQAGWNEGRAAKAAAQAETAAAEGPKPGILKQALQFASDVKFPIAGAIVGKMLSALGTKIAGPSAPVTTQSIRAGGHIIGRHLASAAERAQAVATEAKIAKANEVHPDLLVSRAQAKALRDEIAIAKSKNQVEKLAAKKAALEVEKAEKAKAVDDIPHSTPEEQSVARAKAAELKAKQMKPTVKASEVDLAKGAAADEAMAKMLEEEMGLTPKEETPRMGPVVSKPTQVKAATRRDVIAAEVEKAAVPEKTKKPRGSKASKVTKPVLTKEEKAAKIAALANFGKE